jgi:lysophospholipase L1-like esterase
MGSARCAETRRLGRVLKLVGVNILVFCLLLAGLEIAYRAYTSIVKGRSFFRPNLFITPWITTNDYPPPRIGRDGQPYFRHRSLPTPVEKPPGTLRIIAVGGSTTANEQPFQSAGLDYPLALERKLSTALGGHAVEVLNAGGDGYSTAHSLINIEFRLVEFRPDVILLMHNINDCSVNFFDGGATSDYGNKYLKPYFLNPSLQTTLSVSGFLSQSRFLVWLKLPQILADKTGDLDPDADHRPGIPFFRRNLISIASICRENDILLVLLSQPYSMKPHRFVDTEAFLDYDRVINEVALEQHVDFVDMFAKYGHEERFFVDDFHYTPDGIERFSQILFVELKAILENAGLWSAHEGAPPPPESDAPPTSTPRETGEAPILGPGEGPPHAV